MPIKSFFVLKVIGLRDFGTQRLEGFFRAPFIGWLLEDY
ncbi:hypothetical protein MED121_11274 [Marinomonas sp. MED121]|nr:hypothetical protein MED121_11274 [Marinomonas sp. MED121]